MNIQKTSSITISQVASEAGVSVGTVSRVLNGFSNISSDNLLRVQKAITHLGYQKRRPTQSALRNKSSSRTGNIGLVYTGLGPDWRQHPLVSSYSLGAEEACGEMGFHLILEFAGDSQIMPRCVREGKVDGLLVKATRYVPSFVQDVTDGLPMVGIGFNDPAAPIFQVAPDNRGAGWMVADQLWQRGHRRIAFVCTNAEHPMLVARFQGYESYLRGVESYSSDRVVLERQSGSSAAPEEHPPELDAIVERLWNLGKDQIPTAIITANDWIACGLYPALARRGIRVPEDVSVVGFDNSLTICGTMVPRLTSFDMCFASVARAATLRLLNQIENATKDPEPAIQLIRGRLVERASLRTLPNPASTDGVSRQPLQI